MNATLMIRPARTLLAALAVTAVTATGLSIAPGANEAAHAAEASAAVTVKVGTETRATTGTNIPRGTDNLVLYTGGARTGTNEWGTELAVVDGKITKIETSVGNMAIPSGGYVLSGHGTSSSWLKTNAKVGGTVTRSDAAVSTTTPTPTTPTPTPAPTTDDPYLKQLQTVPGLTHYYPLNAANGAKDLVGGVNGTVKGSGVTFGSAGANFTGSGYVELPDNDDFSVATKGGLTVLVDLTISDWHGKGASEYIHWMGKGVSGAHEWTFRHYVQGGSGEASSRQGRVSFYHFNPAGGLGAGSYFQDAMNGSEHVIEATADMKQVQMIKDGTLRDTDQLSGYNITPKNTTTPVRIGSRGDSTGFLVGKIRRVAFFNRVLTPAETAKLTTAAKQ